MFRSVNSITRTFRLSSYNRITMESVGAETCNLRKELSVKILD